MLAVQLPVGANNWKTTYCISIGSVVFQLLPQNCHAARFSKSSFWISAVSLEQRVLDQQVRPFTVASLSTATVGDFMMPRELHIFFHQSQTQVLFQQYLVGNSFEDLQWLLAARNKITGDFVFLVLPHLKSPYLEQGPWVLIVFLN